MKKNKQKDYFIIPIPMPISIEFKYRKADGTIKFYPKVVPIEIQSDKFSAYVFGEGVRSFKYDGII